jgi:hypothetical protein
VRGMVDRYLASWRVRKLTFRVIQENGADHFSLNHTYFCAVFGEQAILNSASAAISACDQLTSYVYLSMHSVMGKLSGAS